MLDDHEDIEIVAIGAGANQQCTKAMIIARKYISSTGRNYAFIPAFETLNIDDKEITANKWIPIEL